MSIFQKRVKSKNRVSCLKIEILNKIDDFSQRNPDLTMNEVGAVMLNILNEANEKELRQQINQP